MVRHAGIVARLSLVGLLMACTSTSAPPQTAKATHPPELAEETPSPEETATGESRPKKCYSATEPSSLKPLLGLTEKSARARAAALGYYVQVVGRDCQCGDSTAVGGMTADVKPRRLRVYLEDGIVTEIGGGDRRERP